MKLMNSLVHVAALSAAFIFTAGHVSSAQAQPAPRRRHAPPPSPISPPAVDATVTAPVVPAPMSPAADVHHAFNFEAFVDANARVTSRNYLFDEAGRNDLNRGFSVKDGALILSGELSHQTRAVIELPFYTAMGATTNALTFAQGYAQAYAAYTLARAPLTFKLGQYASFFGLEANSSRDRFFTQEGGAKSYITPWTHTGAQVSYATDGSTKFSFLGQVANANTATSGTSSVGALGDNNIELGVQARIDAGIGYGALGVSYDRAQTLPASGTFNDSNDTNTLIELMGGMNLGSFSWGLQLDSKKTAGFKDSAFAATLLGTFQVNADLGLGARVEIMNNTAVLATATGGAAVDEMKNGYGIAVGPSYKLDNNLTVRGDLNYTTMKFDDLNNGNSRSYLGANLSIVATL